MARHSKQHPDPFLEVGQRTPLGVYAVLTAVFSGALVISAVLATKIISVGGLSVPAGVLAFSLTFLATDITNELFGPRAAYRIVIAGFVTLAFVAALIALAIVWPAAPIWDEQEAFESVLLQSERVILGSVIAYLFSQSIDVWLFARIRRATDGRFLWLRNNASTAVAQLLDSAVFVTVAFAGVLPIAPLIFGQWIVKLAIAALDTPIVYVVVGWAGTRLGRSNESTR